MTTKKIKFQMEYETKGAIKYNEVLPSGRVAHYPNVPGAIVGTLYVRKDAFPGVIPPELFVTISTEEIQG